MIRWYDYVVALIAADFIMAGALIFFTFEGSGLVNFAGGLSMLVMYDVWNAYCEWRKTRESQK